MKLSPAQLSILQGLANGFKLSRGTYTDNRPMPPRFSGECRQEFRAAPLDGLEKRGLVKVLPYKLGSFERVYAITEEGRKALGAASSTK